MRKKSHICLGRYLVDTAYVLELHHYRKAFLWGSILPDCRPSFVTKKHEFDGTYQDVKRSIRRLTWDYGILRNKRVYCRDMGEVVHYLADYFTYPHNVGYPGSLKDHCHYENELKHYLKEYISSGKAAKDQTEFYQFYSEEELFAYIEACHRAYVGEVHTVEGDAAYIVTVCSQVVSGIYQILHQRQEEARQARRAAYRAA